MRCGQYAPKGSACQSLAAAAISRILARQKGRMRLIIDRYYQSLARV